MPLRKFVASNYAHERQDYVDFKRDSGAVARIQLGKSYDLSQAEIDSLSRFVQLVPGTTAEEPIVLSGRSSAPFRIPLTVDRTKIPSTLTNFLLQVDLSQTQHFLQRAQPDRSDVRFYAADGTTLLDHEWDGIDPSLLTADGAVCWFQDDRAVVYNRSLYFGVVTSIGDIKIVHIDLLTGAVSYFVLKGSLQIDDHASPSIVIRPDGRIVVFYSAHTGTTLFYRISTNPEDITAFGTEFSVPAGAGSHRTYSNPFFLQSENNKAYLFWRDAPYCVLATSTDLATCSPTVGATWSTPVSLIGNGTERPYVKYFSNRVDRIDLWLTDGHPREYATGTSVYHGYIKGGRLYDSFDRNLGSISPGAPLNASEFTLVDDGKAANGKSPRWVWDVVRYRGEVWALYTIIVSASDHRLGVARLRGQKWESAELDAIGGTIGGTVGITPENDYSGGASLNKRYPYELFVSPKVGQAWEAQKWFIGDDLQIRRKQPITEESESTIKNVRPMVPFIMDDKSVPFSPEVLYMSGRYSAFANNPTDGYYTGIRCWPAIAAISTGPTSARVKVPSIGTASDTVIYVGYGGSKSRARRRKPYSEWAFAVMGGDADALRDGMRNVVGVKPHVRKAVGFFGLASPVAAETQGSRGKWMDFSGKNGMYGGAVISSEPPAINVAGWSKIFVFVWFSTSNAPGASPEVFLSNWHSVGNYQSSVGSPANSGFMLRRQTNGRLNGVVSVNNATIGGDFGTDVSVLADGLEHLYGMEYDQSSGLLRGFRDEVISTQTFPASGALDPDISGPWVGYGHDVHGTSGVASANGRLGEARVAGPSRSVSVNELIAEFRNLRTAGFLTVGVPEAL